MQDRGAPLLAKGITTSERYGRRTYSTARGERNAYGDGPQGERSLRVANPERR